MAALFVSRYRVHPDESNRKQLPMLEDDDIFTLWLTHKRLVVPMEGTSENSRSIVFFRLCPEEGTTNMTGSMALPIIGTFRLSATCTEELVLKYFLGSDKIECPKFEVAAESAVSSTFL